jgi:two-component system, OmpR family, phosphate regulon sensor histidine kinase PhoR
MSRSTIRIIIFLAAAIFIGLVSTQIVWVKRAYQIADQQKKHEIELALIDVVQSIQLHSGDSTFLIDPVKLVSQNFYRVQINEELQPFYLENMLRTEFLNREINHDFQYSIYNCFNDSVVFTKIVSNEEDLESQVSQAPSVQWDDDGHYFSVFFPTLHFEVLGEMKFWIASSTILLCVLGFFVYVINIILKQKRLSEIKTDFINNMTHELKTPISTIGLSSEVLLQKDVALNPERIKNYAQIIKSENQRLQTQVERVLQMARLETEEIQLSKKDCDIHELIEVAVPSIELNFRDVALSIETRLSAEMSTIFGDEMHITNIIYNLLDNAAKYSGDAPKILIETSSDKTGVTIAVEDNGMGIPKEYRKMVFEKFFRIPTGNVHDVKGFGIGLHYVKSITRAHRGSVKITNGSGTGARFEVRIPYGTEFD